MIISKAMDMEESLNKLKAWKEQNIGFDYNTAWRIGHILADAEFPAAMDFFIQGLDDPNWRWRDDCISFLGFHYLLEADTLRKIRNILLYDPSSNARITAASVLGKQSSLPDTALSSAVKNDSNHLVKESAFEAILVLAGVSNKTIHHEIKKIKTEGIQPNLSEVKRVIKGENINLAEDFFD